MIRNNRKVINILGREVFMFTHEEVSNKALTPYQITINMARGKFDLHEHHSETYWTFYGPGIITRFVRKTPRGNYAVMGHGTSPHNTPEEAIVKYCERIYQAKDIFLSKEKEQEAKNEPDITISLQNMR